jgi:GNAT superfamily N-acetyltransferase
VIREARSDADLASYAAAWSEISPRDAISAEFVKARLAQESERLYLLAEEDACVVGCGVVTGSNFPGRRFVIVGVLPEHRRRGFGSRLLERCLAHARLLGAERATSYVWEDCEPGLAFADQRGFVEFERGVELLRQLADEDVPPPPTGIEIVELAPEHYSAAYEIWIEGVADIPTCEPAEVMAYERWLTETLAKELVLVALDGEMVAGFAALEDRDREAGLAGNDLTTVRRSHRRRGIAEALKRAQLVRARQLGYRRVVTGQDEANIAMQRLNEKLGYEPLPATIMVRRSLGK